MIFKTRLRDTPYPQFVRELNFLLRKSGITHSRQQIRAEVTPGNNRSAPSTEEDTPKIGRVILYMEEHLAEELSLEELAEQAELSKYQLIRRFREEEGTTPWKYLICKRIEKAKQLLERGMPPGQVAVETGFYAQSHLSRVFRDKTGFIPKEYQSKNFRNRN